MISCLYRISVSFPSSNLLPIDKLFPLIILKFLRVLKVFVDWEKRVKYKVVVPRNLPSVAINCHFNCKFNFRVRKCIG